jgi:hypothetical protein
MEFDEKVCSKLLDLVDLLETLGRDKLTLSMVLERHLSPVKWREEFAELRADDDAQKRVEVHLADILESRRQWMELVAALRKGDQPQIPKSRIQ